MFCIRGCGAGHAGQEACAGREGHHGISLSNELGLANLLEDVGDVRFVGPLVALAGKIGLALLFEVVSDELGFGIPLTALAISIGCCDIGQVLRTDDEMMDSNPTPPREISSGNGNEVRVCMFGERERPARTKVEHRLTAGPPRSS